MSSLSMGLTAAATFRLFAVSGAGRPADIYTSLVTAHGVLMVYAVIPVFVFSL